MGVDFGIMIGYGIRWVNAETLTNSEEDLLDTCGFWYDSRHQVVLFEHENIDVKYASDEPRDLKQIIARLSEIGNNDIDKIESILDKGDFLDEDGNPTREPTIKLFLIPYVS